ncbi:hypothetical protein [Streptomyces lichenis]|uniref:Uncharacterized protein n=1 Tax=Streptomyces lichenis TaxID=2306967 RepID=A0ABT0I4A9_9ACTN|nr:hypothetical protein [Streptomyces lichenis]MCK8676154.1 hypothetical protein [Streptomyces lichenis]
MSRFKISCPARIIFRDDEMRMMAALDGGFQLEQLLYCTLEAGHTSLHHTIAQGVAGTETTPPWSLHARWGDNPHGPERELVRLDDCPVTSLPGSVQSESCWLQKDHEGRHAYEFGPLAERRRRESALRG